MAKPLKNGRKVGGWEKTSYGLYFLGQNIFYMLIAYNVQTFFTDMGITAAAVAGILLVTKVWDAINDPLFGVIIDKVRFKKGRFLPWLRISLPLISTASLFLFLMPNNAPVGLKIVWAIVGYACWDMSYTLCDVPIFVLPTSMTDNISERTSILSFGRLLAMVGAMGASIPLAAMQAAMGWKGLAIIYTIAGTITMLPICFAAKERYIVRPENDVTIRQMWNYVKGNKFLLIFYVGMFFTNLTNFSQVMNIYFARYNLGNQGMASLLTMMMALPMFVLAVIIPPLTKKFDKYTLYMFFMIGNVAINVVRFFVGYSNVGLFLVGTALSGVMMGGFGLLVYMFTPDCLEYGTYHTGERAEGVAASIQTFTTKLVGAMTGTLGMFLLSLFGFVEGENALQPNSALSGIWLCMSIVPAIGGIIAIAILSKYKLRDKDVQVMAEYNSGKITKEEANAKLEAKYGPAADLGKMTITHD